MPDKDVETIQDKQRYLLFKIIRF